MPGAIFGFPTRPTTGQGMVWNEGLGGAMSPGSLQNTGAGLTGFTDNRIPFGSAIGGLEDSADLTWNGSTLTVAGEQTVSGRFAIGTLQSGVQFVISTNTQTATTQVMNQADAAVNANATGSFRYYMCTPNTADAAFTCPNLFGYLVTTQTKGASSTVTRFAGYHCLRSAAYSNNAAFSYKSNNSMAFTGNWCLYNDTADNNYLGTGATLINTTTDDGVNKLQVNGGILTAASTTARASIRLPHGNAPTSPVDGDVWTTTAGLFVRINGATVGPLS